MYKKALKELFKGTGIKVDVDKDGTYANFSTKNINCEFYPCNDSGYLTATYIVDDKKQTLDLHIEDDYYEIKRVVKQLLKVS